MTRPSKPWAGRFEKGTERLVEEFSASIGYDRRLYRQDIAGSIAHARMLGRQAILSQDEAQAIVSGLDQIRAEIEEGRFAFRDDLEDIHMNIEVRLREIIGEAAGRLHTARSRNDQVAVDLRLYLKDVCAETIQALRGFQEALLAQAEANHEVILPGYTHLQRAQPVLLAHHFLAYFEMFQRDCQRFQQAAERADVLPLGSGALAGVPYPLDRESVAAELGFSQISRNSLDAVSDRDFVLDYLAAAGTCMMHLSRLSEEMVLWSSAEFGFVEMDDAYATGSSIMPQKKNPDVAELVRGKTGRVYGHLMGMLTTLKGLPLSYNRDLQEDKEALFGAVDTLLASLRVFTGMVATLHVLPERCLTAAGGSYTLATDLADYLVNKGLPFRDAHRVTGELVRYALDAGKDFPDLSIEEYRRFSPLFGEEVFSISVQSSVAARDVPGGTAPVRVAAALQLARQILDESSEPGP